MDNMTGAKTPENVPSVLVLDSSENVPNSTYALLLDAPIWFLPNIPEIFLMMFFPAISDPSDSSGLFVEPWEEAIMFVIKYKPPYIQIKEQ